jgi:uncharacterized membrane protein YfcA
MIYFLLLLVGLLVGFSSSFFGVGGGIIMVPALTYLFPEMPLSMVIATSLATICLNSQQTVYFIFKSGEKFPLSCVIPLCLMAGTGAFLGTTYIEYINPILTKRIFATLLFIGILKPFIPGSIKNNNETIAPSYVMGIAGLLGGIISALTGQGGGLIVMPLISIMTKLKLRLHVIYSNISMLFSSMLAMLAHAIVATPEYRPVDSSLMVGRIPMFLVIILVLSSLFTVKIGLKLNNIMKPETKRWYVLIIIGSVGVNILMSTF